MEARLIIDIQSDWHPGTGRGSGFHLDALAHAGADGLPRLPGRTLKGLLRDALWRAEQWGWSDVPRGTTETLFGTWTNPEVFDEGGRDAEAGDDNLSQPGVLRVGDACLPEDLAAYLATDQGRPLIVGLYREHFSTAIDHDTGVAKSRSLRGMQVVVPLQLEARLSVIPGCTPPTGWREMLDAVLPLIMAVGAHRTRGFGRARLSFKEGATHA